MSSMKLKCYLERMGMTREMEESSLGRNTPNTKIKLGRLIELH